MLRKMNLKIKNQLTKLNFFEMSNWIRVTEKLPEKAGFVICHKHNGLITALYFDSDNKFWYNEIEQTQQVTHWQPLPEPPKEK